MLMYSCSYLNVYWVQLLPGYLNETCTPSCSHVVTRSSHTND